MKPSRRKQRNIQHDHRERVPGCYRCELNEDEVLPCECKEEDWMCPNCVTPWKCNGPHFCPKCQSKDL